MQLPALLRISQSLGYVVFTGGNYDLNLIAQRSKERVAGQEDDLISLVFLENGRWKELAWPCSVDPGRKYLANPLNSGGTAIIAPGQYRGAYQRGLHKGTPALVQVGSITINRDADKDGILEPGSKVTGLFGVNIHKDYGVGADASAGCIVLPQTHLNELLSIVEKAEPIWGSKLSLTVIEM